MPQIDPSLAVLQQTVSMSALKSAMSTQAAGAIVMLRDFQRNQMNLAASAPHPFLGKHFDARI